MKALIGWQIAMQITADGIAYYLIPPAPSGWRVEVLCSGRDSYELFITDPTEELVVDGTEYETLVEAIAVADDTIAVLMAFEFDEHQKDEL